MALTVAAKVKVETGTTSPGPTPHETRARWSAAVPDDSPTACATPTRSATSCSKASRSGPAGATHPEQHGAQDVLLLELADVGGRQQDAEAHRPHPGRGERGSTGCRRHDDGSARVTATRSIPHELLSSPRPRTGAGGSHDLRWSRCDRNPEPLLERPAVDCASAASNWLAPRRPRPADALIPRGDATRQPAALRRGRPDRRVKPSATTAPTRAPSVLATTSTYSADRAASSRPWTASTHAEPTKP